METGRTKTMQLLARPIYEVMITGFQNQAERHLLLLPSGSLIVALMREGSPAYIDLQEEF